MRKNSTLTIISSLFICLLAGILIFLAPSSGYARNELSLVSGYGFAGKTSGDMSAGSSFGGISVSALSRKGLEFGLVALTSYNNDSGGKTTDLSTTGLEIGKQIFPASRVQPYLGIGTGLYWIKYSETSSGTTLTDESLYTFGIVAKGGVRLFVNDRFMVGVEAAYRAFGIEADVKATPASQPKSERLDSQLLSIGIGAGYVF